MYKIGTKGFTIVELLVVIVVIGILAAVTIVSYNGITQKASLAVIQFDLDNAYKRLEMYKVQNSSYPTEIDATYCPKSPVPDTNNCLKFSQGMVFTGYIGNMSSFGLSVTKDSKVYSITQKGAVLSSGINLLPNSQNLKTVPNQVGMGTAEKKTDETIPYWRVTATSSVSTYDNNTTALALTPGVAYTISCEVRVPTAGSVSFWNNRGINTGIPANTWTKIYFTFTYTSGYRIGGNNYSGIQLDYRNWKIETGSIATDWTPAPSDL
jgi:general secretion pathway protein G